jgi:hypothetical protein
MFWFKERCNTLRKKEPINRLEENITYNERYHTSPIPHLYSWKKTLDDIENDQLLKTKYLRINNKREFFLTRFMFEVPIDSLEKQIGS